MSRFLEEILVASLIEHKDDVIGSKTIIDMPELIGSYKMNNRLIIQTRCLRPGKNPLLIFVRLRTINRPIYSDHRVAETLLGMMQVRCRWDMVWHTMLIGSVQMNYKIVF